MEMIKPTTTSQQWLDDPNTAASLTDEFVENSFEFLSSSGFWGSVAAGILLLLKFVPKFAPAYEGLATLATTILAPKVHQDKLKQVNQYAQGYVTTVKVIEDVANQLPNSNGVKNVKNILKKVTDSPFHDAVQTITADVHPDKPIVKVTKLSS